MYLKMELTVDHAWKGTMAKIVVVDDEKMQRNMLKGLLEIEGHDVYVAEDGVHAMEVVKEQKPDLVLTDLRMPRMDGMDLLRELKTTQSCKTVIVITGHGTPDDVKTAFVEGAFAYLQKPVDFDDLCGHIKASLS